MELLAIIIFIVVTILNADAETKKKRKRFEERQKRRTAPIPIDTRETKSKLPKEIIPVEELPKKDLPIEIFPIEELPKEVNVKKEVFEVAEKIEEKKEIEKEKVSVTKEFKVRSFKKTPEPFLEMSNEELIKGIIMAEILSPPKALSKKTYRRR